MIISVEGKLGSGKTYWCVRYLLEKFYTWNDAIDQYVPRYQDLRIISNIDGLGVPHEDLKEAIAEKKVTGVFSEEFISGSAHCVYIIDESQYLFDRRFSNKEVFRFFQMSRHWGVDILLITQDVDTLARELRSLCEYTVKAYPRSRSMSGVMRYGWISEGEVFKTQTYKFDWKVGRMYQSRTKRETMSMPITWRRYAVLGAVLVIVAGVALAYGVGVFYPDTSSGPKGSAPGASSREQGSASASEARARYLSQQQAFSRSGSAGASRSARGERVAQSSEAVKNNGGDGQREIGVGVDGDDEQRMDRKNGMRRSLEMKHEPLVPARCYEELDGWRVCFEGAKPIGRYKIHNEFQEVEARRRGVVMRDEKYMGRELTVRQ